MSSNLFLHFVFFTMILASSHSFAVEDDHPRPSPPPVAIGTPSGSGFWDKDIKIGDLKSGFKGRLSRYRYFLKEITSFPGIKDNKLYDYIDPAVKGFTPIDIQLFEKILMLKYLNKPEKERLALNKINSFLDENYKTQTLPGKICDNAHLAEPFYLSDLKNWTFDAVKKGDLEAVRAFLDNYNLLKIKDDEGYNLLSYAVMYHQNDVAEFLIKRKINLNEENKYGASSLTIATRNNNSYAVRLLTQHKCKVHHKDQFGNTPIDYALMNNNKEIYEYLLETQE
jgi:hypothetical protein